MLAKLDAVDAPSPLADVDLEVALVDPLRDRLLELLDWSLPPLPWSSGGRFLLLPRACRPVESLGSSADVDKSSEAEAEEIALVTQKFDLDVASALGLRGSKRDVTSTGKPAPSNDVCSPSVGGGVFLLSFISESVPFLSSSRSWWQNNSKCDSSRRPRAIFRPTYVGNTTHPNNFIPSHGLLLLLMRTSTRGSRYHFCGS